MNTPKGVRKKISLAKSTLSSGGRPPYRPAPTGSAPSKANDDSTPAVNFFTQVYAVVRLIPKGQVATYGQVAAVLENPRAARTVGWALNGLPDSMESEVPWHRVINAKGRISNSGGRHGGAEEQARRLKREGVKFDKTGRCDLRRYLWEPPMNLRLGRNA
jgi:methylated-DNA-protein-cysteine methyltransferase related protein